MLLLKQEAGCSRPSQHSFCIKLITEHGTLHRKLHHKPFVCGTELAQNTRLVTGYETSSESFLTLSLPLTSKTEWSIIVLSIGCKLEPPGEI